MKQKKAVSSVTVNRRARYDYTLGEELVCGMSLTGPEVRSIRDHHVQLKGSFVTIKDGELWLNNLTLGADTVRNIKLLVTKKQLAALARARQDGYSLVPIRLDGGSRHIKLVIATARGKKKYDKRQSIKNRDIDRGRY
ncbi:SsrA-binding protein [Candidatus Saccharibacteria bacterium]|nr:SsrA-binding protein [Candidatus Saccharibacteria bacterium]